MGYMKISATLDDERISRIIDKISEMKTELDFMVNLSNEERMKLRKAGGKRQGYVNDVLSAVKANPDTIPKSIDTEDYYKKAKFFLSLEEIFMHFRPVFEGLSDTLMAASHEAITVTDQCYGHLKQAARGNSNLTDTVAKLSRHHAKTKSKKEESPS